MLLVIAGLGMDVTALKSGLVGGFFSLSYTRKRTARTALASIASGAILAGYLGPLVADFFAVTGKAYSGACFLLGLLSMQVVPWIFELAQAAVTGRADRLAGKPKNGANE